MAIKFQEGFVWVFEDDSFTAVRQGGQVEVWTNDGRQQVGVLPELAGKEDVESVLRFYAAGRDDGFTEGRVRLAEELREKLGMA